MAAFLILLNCHPGVEAEEAEDALVGDPGRAGDVELLQEVAVLAQHAHHIVVGATAKREHGEEGGVSEGREIDKTGWGWWSDTWLG